MKSFAKESTTVGLWHFKETSGSTHSDGSGNGYTITDSANAPTRTTTTDFGGGLSFDGADDMTERSGGGANLEAASITVEALVRKPAPHSGDTDAIIAYFPRGAANDGRGWFLLLNSTGFLQFSIGPGTGAFSNVVANAVFPTDRWVYCAGTYDGTNLHLYQCGVVVATPVASAAISYAASGAANPATYKTVSLGATQQNDATPTYTSFGRLEIADIRVSNVAKSDAAIAAEQVAQEFCEVEPKVTPSEIAYGFDATFPHGPYHRYKTIRAATEMLNNLVLGP